MCPHQAPSPVRLPCNSIDASSDWFWGIVLQLLVNWDVLWFPWNNTLADVCSPIIGENWSNIFPIMIALFCAKKKLLHRCAQWCKSFHFKWNAFRSVIYPWFFVTLRFVPRNPECNSFRYRSVFVPKTLGFHYNPMYFKAFWAQKWKTYPQKKPHYLPLVPKTLIMGVVMKQ